MSWFSKPYTKTTRTKDGGMKIKIVVPKVSLRSNAAYNKINRTKLTKLK